MKNLECGFRWRVDFATSWREVGQGPGAVGVDFVGETGEVFVSVVIVYGRRHCSAVRG